MLPGRFLSLRYLVRIVVSLILDKKLLNVIASPGPTIDYCFSTTAEQPTSGNCKWVEISNSTFEFGNLERNTLQIPADTNITFLLLKCTASHPVKWLARKPLGAVELVRSIEDSRFNQSPRCGEPNSYSQRVFIELGKDFSKKLSCKSFSDPDLVAEVYLKAPDRGYRYWDISQGSPVGFVLKPSVRTQRYHILPCDASEFHRDYFWSLTFVRKEATYSSISDISEGCVECICKSSCETFPCDSRSFCGEIPQNYWKTNKPMIRVDPDFSSCKSNASCARSLTKSYLNMSTRRKDCNADGLISCGDYARAHLKGDWRKCNERLTDSTEKILANNFTSCLFEIKENLTIFIAGPYDYDPRIGLRVLKVLDVMSAYECVFDSDKYYRTFPLRPHTQVHADLSYDHDIETFRCEHNRKELDKPELYFARCESLLECALKFEPITPYIYHYPFSSPNIYEKVELDPDFPSKGYRNSYTHGFVQCAVVYRDYREILGEIDYFFTGLNYKKYLSSERPPPDAVILLSTINHQQFDHSFSDAFHCKISTFVLVPNVQFLVEYSTGKKELVKPGEVSAIASATDLSHDKEYASQTTELALNVSAGMVKIICYASWIMSEDCAHSEIRLNGYKTSTSEPGLTPIPTKEFSKLVVQPGRYTCKLVSVRPLKQIEMPPLIVKQLPVREVWLDVAVGNCASERKIVIDCEAEGNPTPNYNWNKDGKQLNLETHNPRIYKKPGQGTLVIGTPTDDDAGIYECYASNKWGIARSNPVFVRKMEPGSSSGTQISITAEEGHPLKIPCGSPHRGSKHRANWINQTARGQMKSIDSPWNTVDPEGHLWFLKVRQEDRSQDFFYVCMSFSLEKNESKVGNSVLLIVAPKKTLGPSGEDSLVQLYTTSNNTVALKGQDVEMCCIFSGTPLPKIEWTRKGGQPSADRAEYENYGTTLRIRNVDFSDNGIYTCNASNRVAPAIIYDVNLFVFATPYFTVQPMIQEAPEGGTAFFHCKGGGNPSPEITWIHNGAPLHEAPNNPRRRILGNNTIVIENLTRKDTGNYGCNVTNSFSFVYKDAYVNVFTEGADDQIDAVPFNKTAVAISVVGVVLLTAAVILIHALWKKYIRALKVTRNLTNKEAEEFYSGKTGDKNSEKGVPVELLPFPVDKRIPIEDLEIEDTVLGEGQFGIVHKGRFKDQCVAVKSSKSAADVEYFKAFLQEIKLMAFIDDHDNIVRFYGAVVDKIEERVCSAVLELSPLGDLRGYLRSHSKGFSETDEELSPETINSNEGKLTPRTLLQFCKQIAAGMEFLANKTVIHGDLATRNVLVYENGVVKITDFGLSRKLYDCANYTKTKQVPLPWRWMAIESLRFFEFSTKSDIWSFGVTMWEIFSLCQVPFASVKWTTDFADKLESGLRLSKPKHCHPMTYDWMMRCWASIPNNRPTFTDCKVFLTATCANGSDDNYYYPIDRNNLASVVTIIV